MRALATLGFFKKIATAWWKKNSKPSGKGRRVKQLINRGVWGAAALGLLALVASPVVAEDTICARVKIEIKQELTLERQGFDAEMKINNTLDGSSLTDVSVQVKITDEQGLPIAVSADPNNTSAKFFIRVSNKENIANVDGTGTVAPATTATINWLLVPAPGAAGTTPLGKKYLIGATLKYKFGAEEQTLDVSPDVITVKPMPLLTLDYFLTQDVVADDPLTAEIEAIEPFTLGVRVKNTGLATAKALKIDSAQPKIIENNQGLLINFTLTGSYVNDAPVQNTLLVNFGDILASTAKVGRWNMESTLAGRFTEFTARFSHADELGGALTSLMQATNAHFLIRDVRVDAPGRDFVRDFLAKDGDTLRVYESDSQDSDVLNLSAQASLTATTGSNGNAVYQLTAPASAGFMYVRLPDPFLGQKALGTIVRADAKTMLPENVWLSHNRNPNTKANEFWISFFDVNSPGVYSAEFNAPAPVAQPPLIQFIPDRTVKEGKQVSFLVEASSPDGKAVTLSAAPLPNGASFTAQPKTTGLAESVFNWTPAKGQAGSYLLVYTATDGTLTSTRSAVITVDNAPPPGPGTPTIEAPASGAQVTALQPTLTVRTGTHPEDPTAQVIFEVYADEAMSQPLATGTVAKSTESTTGWQVTPALNDNTTYWWRARAFGGGGEGLFSAWVNGHFFVNQFNDAPDSFNLTAPSPGIEVADAQPLLSWTNSADKDGDAITYEIRVYRDAALTDLVTSAIDIVGGEEGSSSWRVDVALTNHATYHWRVIARDALGAETPTPARFFIVNTGNTAPTLPALVSPVPGGQTTTSSTALVIDNATDAESDLLTYVFELDTVNTFDSGSKRSSGQVMQSASAQTSWPISNLVENQRYHWRVKTQDGRAESEWSVGDFLMNAINEAPPTPTVRNPGDGAWVASRQPSLEANPVEDPEGETVRYQLEIYRDAEMTQRVTDGSSETQAWIVPTELADKTTHWWRVRAMDSLGATSAWSPLTIMYVSTAPYQDPTIEITTPATAIQPTETGSGKTVALHWAGTDSNIEPTVALYYTTSKDSFNGTLIIDGIRQTAGTQSGDYVWDVSQLEPGAYYVYGMIYDARGVGRAWAPGAVVIVPSEQTGSIGVTTEDPLNTKEDGRRATFTVQLGSAPLAEVVVPLSSTDRYEGTVEPASLHFTPGNWNVMQTVSVIGANDCVPDANQQFQVLVGKAVTVDPNYIGLSGTPVNVVNHRDLDRGTTTDPTIHLCNFSVVSERQLGKSVWEYTLKAELTNTGSDVAGVTANLQSAPAGINIEDGTLVFGAVNAMETVHSTDVIVLRSRHPLPQATLRSGKGFSWTVSTP